MNKEYLNKVSKVKKRNFARIQEFLPEIDAIEARVLDVWNGEYKTALQNLIDAEHNFQYKIEEANNESANIADEIAEIMAKLDDLGAAYPFDLEDAESNLKILRDWLDYTQRELDENKLT